MPRTITMRMAVAVGDGDWMPFSAEPAIVYPDVLISVLSADEERARQPWRTTAGEPLIIDEIVLKNTTTETIDVVVQTGLTKLGSEEPAVAEIHNLRVKELERISLPPKVALSTLNLEPGVYTLDVTVLDKHDEAQLGEFTLFVELTP